jgi:hypothetical protein
MRTLLCRTTGLFLLLLVLLAPAAQAQTELQLVERAPGGPESAAPTCVRLTQAGEWVAEPVLHAPWTPLLADPITCWTAFGIALVVLYVLAFGFFQSRVRGGSGAVSSFGFSMALLVFFGAVIGYFTTGHLSYADNWCVDHTMNGIIGAPPARSNEAVILQFGVGINEIIDRGAIPLKAHARLTPWYLWLPAGVLGAIFFAFSFRSTKASTSAPVERGSTGNGTSNNVDEW